MTWDKHYEELKPNFFSLKLRNSSTIIFFIMSIILNIVIYICFWKFLATDALWETLISFFVFSFISIFFPTFMFYFSFFFSNSIKIFYNKNDDLFLGFNQKKYLDKKLKNLKGIKNIFFITWLGKKEEDSKLKRAIYFYANYKYIQYLKKYKTYSFTAMYIMEILFFTSISFWGLMLVLTIDYKNTCPNIMFLYSILYISYIILVSYSVYSQKEQDLFFKENLIGFPENYFLVDSNLDMYEKEEEKSVDVSAILFGVLFTLYLTLAYNSIYNVGVDIKKISTKIECTNHNINKKYQEKNNALQ